MRSPHLRQDFVEPLQRPVEVHLDPARRARHVLPVVLGAPPLDEAHADGAHLGQLVNRLEPVIHALGQKRRKLCVIEDLQRTACRNLAHCRRVKAVVVVTVARLHKYCRVGQAFGIYLENERQSNIV